MGDAMQGELLVSGSMYLPGGMNSWGQPTALLDTQYVASMNTTSRGGRVRTRPGSKILADITGDNLQGCTFFVPVNGTPAHVIACDGKVYVANPPFRTYVQLANIQFSPYSKYVTWAVCQQSTDYDNEGQLYFLSSPKTVLIMQDGATRAAYWDGVNNGHINPTPSGSDVTQPDRDGTRIGLWMSWSNNRLWVSRRNQIFASDIGNPLKFTETQYLNEGRAFYLSGNCTGIIETPDRSGILCFTERDGTLILSSIQDRSKWLNTDGFVKTILPNTGCIAPRSLVNQYGLTWWFSSTGLQNLDSALNQNITSKLFYQDQAMALSKQNIGADMSGICSGYYENYLVVSVPSGDPYNRHTWVLDQNPAENNSNAWPSYWTGWRPVEWTRAVINGQERVLFVSKDLDDVNRVWEAFLPERTDNGSNITCFLQTKQHNFGDVYRKQWRYARLFLSNILGEVSLRWFAFPYQGSPYEIGTKEMVATPGQVYDNTGYGGTDSGYDNDLGWNRPQFRQVYSESNQGGAGLTCTSCDIQKDTTDNLDYAFGLFVMWSGDMAIDGYQIYTGRDKERESGRCELNENGPRSLNFFGCGDDTLFPAGSPWGAGWGDTETACATDEGSTSGSGDDTQVCSTQTRNSLISQQDAVRLATAAASFDAQFRAGIFI